VAVEAIKNRLPGFYLVSVASFQPFSRFQDLNPPTTLFVFASSFCLFLHLFFVGFILGLFTTLPRQLRQLGAVLEPQSFALPGTWVLVRRFDDRPSFGQLWSKKMSQHHENKGPGQSTRSNFD